MTLVQKIAHYVTDLKYDDIPEDALKIAKYLIFDSIGTGLGGYQRGLGKKAARFGAMQMPGNEATLLGSGEKSSMEGAAFSNGVMIKILGMDDSHRSAGHIASQMIPAVLAVSEACGTSGKEMLTAIVGAYDFAIRVGEQVRAEQRARGMDLKGTVGPMAAALAAARCAGCDAETTANALALAMDMASGTEQYVYEGGDCDTKDLIAGFGARNGVFAVRLAMNGFYGAQGALDGDYGFFRAYGDGNFDVSVFDDLGENFAITSTAFKPHGGCRHTHQAIDAAQKLRTQVEFAPEDIENVRIETYGYALRPIFRVNPDPPSRDVAGLSIRVSTAIALTQGQAFPDDFAHWDAPEVRRLRHITDIAVEPEIDTSYPALNGCKLSITLKSGETHSAYLPNMKGEPEFRMTDEEFVVKFRVLTSDLFDTEQADAIFAYCNDLAKQDSIAPLMSMTTG
ncbi:MAG: MmgE/PrpD family protein [Chloroflexota bacterium]